MKKIIVATILTLASINAASAASNVGCGFGTMIFDGKKGKVSEILAATTNVYTQTFGITSGTAGCVSDGVIKYQAALSTFMSANFDKVSHDMAVGKGESLETMANLMGIAQQDKASFYQATRENFDAIVASENITVKEVISNLGKVLANNTKLAQYTV